MNALETLPESWDADRDVVFFALTWRLFSPAFVAGASALLSSYDEVVAAAA